MAKSCQFIALGDPFFARDARRVAIDLLGKVIRVRYQRQWLMAQIIETEAYLLTDKASHASLGYTPKRAALFMPPGTIYMYYARGGDSLNVSCLGAGNAVLIKSALPFLMHADAAAMLATMQSLNPPASGPGVRAPHQLCRGQTLLCRALDLKVPVWDQQSFDPKKFYISDVGLRPRQVIQAKRLGIAADRDPHYLYRYIDYDQAAFCSENPLTKRRYQQGVDYQLYP